MMVFIVMNDFTNSLFLPSLRNDGVAEQTADKNLRI